MRIPALNEIVRQALNYAPKYPEDHEDLNYLILYPDDYQEFGSDMEGNVALLVDEENAREIKRLAERTIERLDD